MDERAIEQITKTVNVFVKTNPYLLKRDERADLVNTVFCHFLEKGLIEKYDEDITTFEYFIARATKNHLIDMTRKRILETSSLNQTIRTEDSEKTEIVEMIESPAYDFDSAGLLAEIVANVPDTQISKSYNLTWRELLNMVIEGYRPKEIAKKVIVTTAKGETRNISSGRVSQLIGELRTMCLAIA